MASAALREVVAAAFERRVAPLDGLAAGDGGRIAATAGADHCLTVRSDDPRVVKEAHVTTYHVLWELVHVFLDEPAADADADSGDLGALYPFLYGAQDRTAAVVDD